MNNAILNAKNTCESQFSYPKPLKMVWITAAWPPDIMGPVSGIIDRAQWFDKYSNFELTILTPQAADGTIDYAGVKNIINYPAKQWHAVPLYRTASLRGGRTIAALIKKITPDIILNCDLERGYLLASWSLPARRWARKNNVPYLGYYHTDYIGFGSLYPFWNKLSFILQAMMWRCYHNLDATLAPSVSARKKAIEFGANNVINIPFDGVNITKFTPKNRDRTALATVLGYEPNGPVILSFSRLSPEKRIDIIIDAIKVLQLTPGYEDTTFIIAGGGTKNYEKILRAQLEKLPRPQLCHFLGVITGGKRTMLLASTDILALASPHETFGITVTEAMASGVRVVCVNSGAPGTYISDGINGFLSAPNDAIAFAQTLRRAITSDPYAIGKAARSTVQNSFSIEKICAQLNDFYTKFIADRTHQPSSISVNLLPLKRI